MSALLIRNGCVIDTEPEVVVLPGTDVLVEDGRIAAVGVGLDAGRDAEVIDATERIVLPGFVDSHRHGWQSVLRAAAIDVDLGAYMGRVGGELAPALTPADVATAAELTGLECIDSGITTVQDYAHIMYSPDHADAAVAGLRGSGVRAVLAYGRPVFGDVWDAADIRRVREQLHDDGALVTMMLGPAGPSYTPAELVVADWNLARDLGIPITVHVGAGPVVQDPIAALRALGVIAPGTVYIHGNSLSDDELALIADSGGALSITPGVEARMGFGAATLPRARRLGVPASLGVDVVTTVPGDAFSLMRAALMSVDAAGGERVPMADVLRIATIGGATALGLADRVGSLRPGKQADVVLLRTDGVGTAGGIDPVGIVVNAHPGDVDTVLVAGEVVKRDGRLVHPGVGKLVADANAVAERLGKIA